jgi:hypothetical protein
MVTVLQCIKTYQSYTQEELEPGIFCARGGRDDHYAKGAGIKELYKTRDILSSVFKNFLPTVHTYVPRYIHT